jgi:hypothetical protein
MTTLPAAVTFGEIKRLLGQINKILGTDEEPVVNPFGPRRDVYFLQFPLPPPPPLPPLSQHWN